MIPHTSFVEQLQVVSEIHAVEVTSKSWIFNEIHNENLGSGPFGVQKIGFSTIIFQKYKIYRKFRNFQKYNLKKSNVTTS